MSVVGLNRLAWDLEHASGLLDRLHADAGQALADYPLTGPERDAVVRRDSRWLLARGMNPVALRNLMVVLGVAHRDMYAPDRTDGA